MEPKILLVDDREDNLLSVETILAPSGYRFVKATSGKEALKILLKEFDFALILMDVKMPNLNGFETAALIYAREKLRNIPIVFITANNYGNENVFQGYKTGGVDYISKPINPELLRAKVAVFIDIYKKNQQLVQAEQRLKTINKSLENEIKERIASEEQVKELNHQLLENITRLESVNKELDRFAFMASHDLQEPLRKVLMFSEHLSSRYKAILDDDGQMYINRIQSSTKRMQSLINDILELSRISADKDSFVETDMNILVNSVVSELEEKIQEKKAKVLVDKLPVLRINPGLIRSLFHNLIHNALKYSKKNTNPIIRISCEVNATPRQNQNGSAKESKKFCRIFVVDNGIGFNQKNAEQIFSIFKRLHLNGEFEGTGIGLAICKKIVEQHNGFISAKSKENEGSVFTISLPFESVVHLQDALSS